MQNLAIPSTVQVLLLTILVGFAVNFMVKCGGLLATYVEARMPADKVTLLKSYAATIVKALDQAPQYASYEASDKKQYAIMYMLNKAENIGFQVLETAAVSAASAVGLTITKADIDAIIEEAVKDMKTQFNTSLKVPAAV